MIFVLTIRHRKQIIVEKKDYLTGLDNRRRFMELAQVVEQTSSNIYSIVLFDIDKFKNVNDTYGHAEGDEVIREVAHVLKQFESPNVFVSRHGGEEFIQLLNDLNEIEAKAIAEDIRIRISKISSLKCRFTISGGVFEADSDKHNLNEAIAFADEGLYVAKQSGRNQIVIKHVS
nr:GGDEF domain-containing protein [Vibrio sp. S11_S32]